MNEEAIPLTWIDKHIAQLEELDDAFSTLTAMNIRTMVNQWKEENERINKEHEDAKQLHRLPMQLKPVLLSGMWW